MMKYEYRFQTNVGLTIDDFGVSLSVLAQD